MARISTRAIRAMQKEDLHLLTARMKKAGALNPEDKNRPLESDETILCQSLWRSPDYR